MNKFSKYVIAPALFFLLFTTVQAAEFIAPDKTEKSGNITLQSTETHRNLYLAGGNVTVNSNTSGDLFVAGGMVSVTGNVEQDLFVAGGSLNINGNVGGDARVAGGNVTINSPINGDLLLGAGNISIGEKARVGGDLVIGGGNVSIDGPVNGNIMIAGGNVTINSQVKGTINARIDQELVFGPHANVTGKVVYHAPKVAIIKQGATVTNLEFKKIEPRVHRGAGAFFTVALLVNLLAYFVAAWLLLHFFGSKVKHAVNMAFDRPWVNLGIGFGGLVVTPVLIGLLFITFIGYYAAFITLAMFGLLLLFSCLLGAIITGSWIMKRFMKTPVTTLTWHTIVIGVVAYKAIGLIPFIGWAAVGIIFLMSFGAVLRAVHADMKREA